MTPRSQPAAAPDQQPQALRARRPRGARGALAVLIAALTVPLLPASGRRRHR